MPSDQPAEDFYVDANGCLTERVVMGGQDVIVHYDDIPESDITLVNGIRCTTALRTVIDIAVDVDRTELQQMVRECLNRKLFTPREAEQRIGQPDMRTRRGAELVLQVVRSLAESA